MIYSSTKLRSLVVASLLFSSTALSALNPNEIVKATPLPTMEQLKNNFAENEIIVTFKKGVDIFKDEKKDEEGEDQYPFGFNDNNQSKENSFLDGFNTKFTDKLNNHFEKDSFDIKGYKNLKMMHLTSKKDSTEELLKFFKSDEMKEYVETVSRNNIMALSSTSDKYYNELWAIENNGQEVNSEEGTKDADMNVLEAWAKTKGEQSVIVAVLDTGVDYTHSDLQDNMWNGEVKHGFDFAGDDEGNNDDDPMPDEPYDEKGHYHGTHVAGTIGAVGDNENGISGVAQHVSIMALKVFRPNGYGYTSDILEALDYVSERVDKGDNIVAINASYGGSGGSQDDSVNVAIKKLGEQGVVFCAAAGNSSKDIDAEPTYPASYDAENIITVAASDQDDKLASFSNYGAKSVDISAPGTNILSTFPDNKYAFLQGTSMATPNVAGSIALLASYYPDSTVAERKAMILDNADKKDAFQEKMVTEGRININTALNDAPEDENSMPVAEKDEVTTPYETAITIDVLKNDSDKDGDDLTIQSTSEPKNGSVKIEDSKVIYTPEKEFEGVDTFDYTISDGKLEATSTVTVTVEKKPNTTPVAEDDAVETDYETTITIEVLKNDSDEDGDKLSVTDVSEAENGSAKIEENKIVYTPNDGFSGEDKFEYTISDGTSKAVASLTVTVNKKQEAVTNHPPVANDDSVSTAYETLITIDVLENDSDEDKDALSVESTTNPANGLVSIENNKIVYKPKAEFSGKDSFEYTISDGKEKATATIFVVVSEKENSKPVAKDDEIKTKFNEAILIDVLENDKDEDADKLTVKTVSTPKNGSVKIEENKVLYTPKKDFSGEDNFEYTISDGKLETTAKVKVIVEEKPNTAPVAKDDEVTTEYNQAITIDVLKNDTDEEKNPLKISDFTQAKNGSVKEDNGKLIYTPNKDFVGDDNFSYKITDGDAEAKATVTIHVKEKEEKEEIQLPIFDNGFNFNKDKWKDVKFNDKPIKFTTKNNTEVNMKANKEKELSGSIHVDGKESKLNIHVPNSSMKINSEGVAIIEFEDKDMSIEIDSNGLISPKLPSLKNAVLPKEAFPLGTELTMSEDSMKFTLPLSKNMKF